MGCPSVVTLEDNLVFSICTHDAATSVLTDADAEPSYWVYEDENDGEILSGTMSKFDGKTGHYTELIACTAANGFEIGKTYTIFIDATVDTDTGGISFGFKVEADLTAIKAVTDALTAAAATKLALSAGTIVAGTVSYDNTAASTTIFYSDDITEATADHFNGRIVIFTSGILQYQATDITDYALAAGEGKFTVTALTEAPGDNDTFVIV